MEKFKELGLSQNVLKTLSEFGFKTPTEIQEKTIPLVLAGKDVIGSSFTGSGKTLAFASSIIEHLKPNNSVQALILTPTRELAEQVTRSIRNFSKYRPLKITSIYGGVDMGLQIRQLPKTDVVVGTPGRILDHLQRKTLDLGRIKFLVLDEVDKMFDMGFYLDVEKILKECPTNRQTMMFSATISSNMDHLSQKYTIQAMSVSVKSHVDSSQLKQIYYDVPDGLKFSLLVQLLKKERNGLVLVFCSTRRNVDFVSHNLSKYGINVQAIHGGMVQKKRINILKSFSVNNSGILICTDVAARGLDIQGISHVYNYDLSKTSEEYIHRIGRTARAGKAGMAVSLLSSRDYENFSSIIHDKNIKIIRENTPFIKKLNMSVELKRKRDFSHKNRSSSQNKNRPFQDRNKPFQRKNRPSFQDRNKPFQRKNRPSFQDRNRSFQRKNSQTKGFYKQK